MRKTFLTCLALAFFSTVLSGCLPTAHTREAAKLDAYVGGPISALVQDMGAPTLSREEGDGNRVSIWRSCRASSDWHGRDFSRYCEITARSDAQGLVTHWEWWGNECPLEGYASGCHGLFWWQP